MRHSQFFCFKPDVFNIKKIFLKLFFIFCFVLVLSSSAYSKNKTKKFYDQKLGRNVDVVEDEIIVRFKDHLSEQSINGKINLRTTSLRKKINKINAHRLKIPKGKELKNIIKEFKQDPDVLYVEPNHIAKVLTMTMNDPDFDKQWGLKKIYAPESWDIEKGKPEVIIAIIDTGIDYNHTDLSGKVIKGYDYANDDNDPIDDNGHGTHCAGIAGAMMNNSIGIVGVAPDCSLMAVKSIDETGEGTYSDVAEGIIYAADNGAKVINLSLGGCSYSQTLQDAVDYAYQKGCVIIAAGGNDNSNQPVYPAACSNVIGVGATNENDEKWQSSNYGSYIDVVAPGVNIYSTGLGNTYFSATGTSASAPFVSGLAGLLFSHNLVLQNYEVENKITQTADDLGTTGRDDYFGYGRINILSTLKNSTIMTHDLNLLSVKISTYCINSDKQIKIRLDILNQGIYTEQSAVVIYINDKKVSEYPLSDIKSGERKCLEIITPIPPDIIEKKDAIIRCEITPVANEEDIYNNSRSIYLEYEENPNNKSIFTLHATNAHTYIAKQSFNKWPNDTANEIWQYFNSIKLGVGDYPNEGVENIYCEDGEIVGITNPGHDYYNTGLEMASPISTSEHFWDPDNPTDIDWRLYTAGARKTAYARAYYIFNSFVIPNYSSGNKEKAYYYFGRVIHLLMDMSIPAHTHNDLHGGIFGGGDESYEDFIGGYGYYSNDSHYSLWNSNNITGWPIDITGWTIYDPFKELAQRTQCFPSDGANGNTANAPENLNTWGYVSGDVEDFWGTPNHDTLTNIGSQLMPLVMKYVASTYQYFAKTVDGQAPTTSHSLSGTAGQNDWYKSNVQLTLTATDAPSNGAGVDKIYYRINSGSWYRYTVSFNISSEGNNTLEYYAVDKLGFTESTKSTSVKIDKTAPTGSISIENGKSNVNYSSVTLTLSASDSVSGVSQMRFSNDGSSWSSWESYNTSKSWTLTSGDGNKTVYVQYKDDAGLTSQYSDSITLDSTKPSSSYSLNPVSPDGDNGWYKSDVTVTLSATGGSGSPISAIYFKIDSGSQQTYSSPFPASTNGNHTIEYWCVDNAANTEDPHNTNCSFKIDKTAPSSSVNALSQYTQSASFNVSWTGSDSLSGLVSSPYDVQYKVGSSGSWTDWTGYIGTSATSAVFGSIAPIAVQDGQTYYFRCKARDNAGNTESYPTSEDTKITVDTTAPTAPVITSLTHCTTAYTEDRNPTFNWTAPSDTSGINEYCFMLDRKQSYTPNPDTDIKITSATTSKSYTNVSDGKWYFHCRAKDTAGNWGATGSYGPVMIDTAPPTFAQIHSSNNLEKAGNTTITLVASEQLDSLTVTVKQNNGLSINVSMTYQDDYLTWTGTYNITAGYDGTATINVSGTDLSGKTGTGSANFTVDTTPPIKSTISSSTHPKDASTSNNNVFFTWTSSTDSLSGLAGYSYALNQIENYDLDTTVETTATSVSFTKLDGTYWFHLRAVDNIGNCSEIERYKFIIDTTSPTFTVSSSKNPAKTGNVIITVAADEKLKQAPSVTIKQNNQVSSTTVTMSSSDNIIWTGTYNAITGYDGTAVINVVGTDLANNTGYGSSIFEIDTIPPTASITLSPASVLKTGEFQITLTITDASTLSEKPSLYYTLSNGTTVGISLTGSDKSWTGKSYIQSTTPEGTATFSFSAIDAAGNTGTTINSGGTFQIDTTIDNNSGGLVVNNDKTSVNVPAGTFSENVNIRISNVDENSGKVKKAYDKILKNKIIKRINNVNLTREFKVYSDISGNEIKIFNKPLNISIPYPDDNQDGIIDGTDIKENNLQIFYLDESNSRWLPVEVCKIDTMGNNLSADVNHFSIYTVMSVIPPSNLSEVIIYPNPCYMKKDGYVRISHIPLSAKNVKISIYNIAGELVRILEEGKTIETQIFYKIGKWDGRNENNQRVASGVYICLIKSENSKITKKVAILW